MPPPNISYLLCREIVFFGKTGSGLVQKQQEGDYSVSPYICLTFSDQTQKLKLLYNQRALKGSSRPEPGLSIS